MRQLHRQITVLFGCLALASCVPVSFTTTTRDPGAGPTRAWPASATCPVPARSASNAARLVVLINAERARAGLGQVTLSPGLNTVAQAFSCEIAARRDIAHVGSDGSTLSERLRRGGITARLAAENTASGYRSPDEVMAGWMTSPHHRDNVLRAGITRIGLGLADGDLPYWVLDFTS